MMRFGKKYLAGIGFIIGQVLIAQTPFVSSKSLSVFPNDSILVSRLQAIPSVIDLTFNSSVKNYIKSYVEQNTKQSSELLSLADYYFPIFEEILDSYELPLELKYLPVIESSLKPTAYSPVGARGLWQFMFGTGKHYGLEINNYIDERRDPVKSTKAAAQYLKDLYDIYGNWHLVIAAYNCGPGNVNKAISRSGGKRDYWDIYYYLPRETRGFVPAFIAAAYLMNYAYAHGIEPAEPQFPVSTDTVLITKDLHLKQVSGSLGISLEQLRELNPVYRRDIIPAAGGPNALILPSDNIISFVSNEDSIYSFNRATYFSNTNDVRNPAKSNYIPEPPSGNLIGLDYKIKSGDNLGYIADWYGIRLSQLKYWNGLYGNTIRAGKTLKIYVPKDKMESLSEVNAMTFEEKQQMIGKSSKEQEGMPITEKDDDNYVYYTVKSGDNLWDISQKFSGVSSDDILRLNGMKSSAIKPGLQLKIKPKDGLD